MTDGAKSDGVKSPWCMVGFYAGGGEIDLGRVFKYRLSLLALGLCFLPN